MDRYDDAEILERRATDDLLGAELLLERSDELLYLIGFHLQQFVEKKMKASLRRREINYPWTHDLRTLLRLFSQKDVAEDDILFLIYFRGLPWNPDTTIISRLRWMVGRCSTEPWSLQNVSKRYGTSIDFQKSVPDPRETVCK